LKYTFFGFCFNARWDFGIYKSATFTPSMMSLSKPRVVSMDTKRVRPPLFQSTFRSSTRRWHRSAHTCEQATGERACLLRASFAGRCRPAAVLSRDYESDLEQTSPIVSHDIVDPRLLARKVPRPYANWLSPPSPIAERTDPWRLAHAGEGMSVNQKFRSSGENSSTSCAVRTSVRNFL